MIEVVQVDLWGRRIGAVARGEDGIASFEYDREFLRSGIQVAPLMMPLRPGVFRFPSLADESFHGLPGLLADSLPDRFGHAVIDAWLARQGRTRDSFGALDRLCYIGDRGMGALTFQPARGPASTRDEPLDVAELVRLAGEVLTARRAFRTTMPADAPHDGLVDILRVGTSAGGARAKALVAWNPDTGEVRSGQLDHGEGFGQWLLKFDGVDANGDHGLADPQGHGVVEYAYHLLATRAGITMTPCRLLEEGGRRHFATLRFDRTPDGRRVHMQTLGALAHLDYNQPGAHGYEEALLAMRRLGMPMAQREELVRRMLFHVVARNQDDHVKNIAFLMDRQGVWSLAPAYDETWAYNPVGRWTSAHQMTIAGKRDGFTLDDLDGVGEAGTLQRGRVRQILGEVVEAVRAWPELARSVGVPPSRIATIAATHRLAW